MILALAVAAAISGGPDKSCLAEIGRVRAQAYADMCIFFAQATHPPCNVANSCAIMQSEIDRSCTDKAKCVVPTVAGRWKCKDDACSDFSFTPARAKARRHH